MKKVTAKQAHNAQVSDSESFNLRVNEWAMKIQSKNWKPFEATRTALKAELKRNGGDFQKAFEEMTQ